MHWDSYCEQTSFRIKEYGRAARDAALKGNHAHSEVMEQKWLDELEKLHEYLDKATLLDALNTVVRAIQAKFPNL